MKAPEKHYIHDDCKGCIFLGNLREGDTLYDLYYCSQNGMPTVIARYGNDGPDYMSGMNSTSLNPLKVAKARAVARGFKIKDWWRF